MLINCHSYYSLRYGVLSVEDLVLNAKKQNYDCIALTDINCMTGVYDFVVTALKYGIKPVVGIEFKNGDELLYVALARNKHGFKELNDHLSAHNICKKPYAKVAPEFNEAYVIYPLKNAPKSLRNNEFIGIQTEEINKVFTQKNLLKKAVILHPVTISSRFNYGLHQCLRAIDHNIIFNKLTDAQYAKINHHLPPIDELLKKYDCLPELALNTLNILEDCCFDVDISSSKNKKHYTGSKYEDLLLLEKLAYEGMALRYGKSNTKALERVKRELKVIDELGFSAYFLITWDIVHHSKSKGYYHVGRGSGANSIIAYCIGITDVDPIELNLFFERFLNPHRVSPPDFDIDWSHLTRDKILDYIFDRFGQQHTCFVGAINTFKNRSPIRELGKVFGLPKEEIDVLVRNRRRNSLNHQQQSTLGALQKHALFDKIERYCSALNKKPNLLTMHSCGILISEEPITQFTALECPPKGYNTAQIDMYIAEDIGLEKVDILSQRGLSSIQTCLNLIEENQGLKPNIHQVAKLKKDPVLNTKLALGQTIGCFYIESPAMRGLLRRLKCDNYITLVAASSIIRPGVAKSGMMREYITRHNDATKTHYPHPIFKEQLGETYGIMVYQEDVIKIAHYFGGLSLADADILRRAMSGKMRDEAEFNAVRARFFNNCKQFGYNMEMAQEVYRQIESFAGFSFCKAHSASYSVESYQSLYLKTHYPLEFIVSVINNFGGFYRTEVYVHEAKMSGADLQLPCVNNSDYYTNIKGKTIHLGFVHIERIDQDLKQKIVQQRTTNGPYASLQNFIARTQIAYNSLKQLIYVGALRFTGLSKPELLINARLLMQNEKPKVQSVLFESSTKQFTMPNFKRSALEDAYDEIDVLGFPVSLSTFQLIQHLPQVSCFVKDLVNLHKKTVIMVGMLISIKDVPTARGHMNFGTWIDEKGDYFDTTHFPDVLLKYPFQGAGCYILQGKVEVDYHFPSVEIIKMQKLPLLADPRYEDVDIKTQLPVTQELTGNKLPRDPYPTKTQVHSLYNKPKQL